MEKFYTVGVANLDLFCKRMRLDSEIGPFLHEQLIAVLNALGEEVLKFGSIEDLSIGVHLDSDNTGARTWKLSEPNFLIIRNYFGRSLCRELGKFSEKEQRKGTDVLFQLNNGNISMKDFEDKLNNSR